MPIHTKEKLHECTDCRKKFIRWDSLIKHMIIQFIEKRPISGLKHQMMIHKEERPHECTECGRKFRFASKMKLHIRERSLMNVLYLYVGRNLLRQPIRWFTKKWSLMNVQNVGSRLDSLKRHIWYTQERSLLNVMYIFGNRFVVSSNLKQCVMTHTGEKLHECAYVGRDSWGLKQHMLIHTGEKPHECDVFGNRFAASSNLKQRMMTHTGEKPYEYTECEKKFIRLDRLKRQIEKTNWMKMITRIITWVPLTQRFISVIKDIFIWIKFIL